MRPTIADRDVYGTMWYCGDDICACTCPRIYLEEKIDHAGTRFPNPRYSYNRITLAEGPFHSGAYGEERNEQLQWLKEACEWYGVKNLSGIEL